MSDTLEKVKVLKATMEEAEEKHHMNTSDDDEKWWATFYAWQEAKKKSFGKHGVNGSWSQMKMMITSEE